MNDNYSWFVDNLDDLWHEIFSFVLGDPKRTNYLSLLLVNRRFNQLLQKNNEFSFFMLRAFILKDKVVLKSETHFPSISFLTSRRGKMMCKQNCTTILAHRKIAQLIDAGCDIRIILHLLQYYRWITDTMMTVTHNKEVREITGKCQELMAILSNHENMNSKRYVRMKELFPDCLCFCTSASLNGETISDCCEQLIKYHAEYRGERDMVLAALHNDGCVLDFVSTELKDDRDVVMEAVDNYGYSLKYASDRLKNDTDVVMHAAQSYGYILQYASQEIRDNRTIVSIAVQNNGYALEYASPTLRDDFDIVSMAVRRYGCSLRYASKRLCANSEIVAMAVNNNKSAYRYASRELQEKDDSHYCLSASAHYSDALFCT